MEFKNIEKNLFLVSHISHNIHTTAGDLQCKMCLQRAKCCKNVQNSGNRRFVQYLFRWFPGWGGVLSSYHCNVTCNAAPLYLGRQSVKLAVFFCRTQRLVLVNIKLKTFSFLPSNILCVDTVDSSIQHCGTFLSKLEDVLLMTSYSYLYPHSGTLAKPVLENKWWDHSYA